MMGNLALAVGMAVDILGGILALSAQLQKVSALIQQAKAEGRDISDAELDALRAERLAARDKALNA
jgi:hypothetical protein